MSAGDRKEILDEAGEYVTKDRNSSYGEPEDNFSAIADVWNAQGVTVSGRPVEPYDVALMMLGMKLARLKHNPRHKDSWVDVIGYAACGWDTAKPVHVAPEVEPVLPYSHDVGINASGSNVLDMIDAVNHKLAAEHEAGWVSQNRCGKSGKGHTGHRYYGGELPEADNSISQILSPPAQWCDGWRTPAQRDIEAVKRVADKQADTRVLDKAFEDRSRRAEADDARREGRA